MATVKLKFRPSTVSDRPGTIVYFITHRRIVRQITTEYKVFPDEWDEKQSRLVIVPENGRAEIVRTLLQKIRRDMGLLDKIIDSCNCDNRVITADDIVRRYQEMVNGKTFFRFMEEVIFQLKRLGKDRTAENYTTALHSFKHFRNDDDLSLDEMDAELMAEYEASLKSRNVVMNTVSFYNRILRAVYNRAVEKGMTSQRYPFRHVYTGIDKTVKRAVSIKVIRRIKELDLSSNPSLDFARDMFLFSFYTRGMSFIDMAYLKKTDLQNGILTYRRRKTGQMLFIRWEESMQEIIDKYPVTDNVYLLPIIKKETNERLVYRNALRLVNNKLKDISKLIGLQSRLTMYVARHSWASIAKSQNIPLSVISEGMGHDSETTTRIYLASLDNSMIDNANNLILKKLE